MDTTYKKVQNYSHYSCIVCALQLSATVDDVEKTPTLSSIPHLIILCMYSVNGQTVNFRWALKVIHIIYLLGLSGDLKKI